METKRKWYQDDEGNTSSLRLIVIPSAIIGQLVVIFGMIALFMNKPDAVGAMGVGVAMVGLAEGAKAWQKVSEK